MIPVNNHLLVEPLKHDSFISSEKQTYEEIGIVIDFDEKIQDSNISRIVKGKTKVLFESWLCKKYPDGKDGFYWLVKWENIDGIKNE